MLINQKVKDLAAKIEEGSGDVAVNAADLVQELNAASRTPENIRRYLPMVMAYDLDKYPLDHAGFAAAYDPLEQEEELFTAFQRYGLAVGKGIAPRRMCDLAIDKLAERFNKISGGACHLGRPNTWQHMPKDKDGNPLLNGQSLELYHDHILAQLRQNVRAYLHHVIIWGKPDLWTSFDRPRLSLPEYNEPFADRLHVDQNPITDFGFTSVQSVLALTDAPEESGALIAVPGSRSYFAIYTGMTEGRRFGPINLDMAAKTAQEMQAMAQPLPMRQGDMITWDNRTTYMRAPNRTFRPRMEFHMAANPAKRTMFMEQTRKETFRIGAGRRMPDAYIFASHEPRYDDQQALDATREKEKLTLLGEYLYGEENYPGASSVPAPIFFP